MTVTQVDSKMAATDSPVPVSAVVIAYNEVNRIAPCLQSLAFCDEILVVDSGSTDGTQALCQELGATVIHQPWLGYGPQKQWAVDRASHDWVLCLDADERIGDQLRGDILRALRNPAQAGYQMPRCNLFMGRWLRHGEGYPDLSLRLFDRRRGHWSQDPVHEKVAVSGDVGRLSGDLLHESEESLAQYLAKQNRYTSLQAQMLADRGKRVSAAKMVVSPMLRFLKFMLLRGGILDGVPGLVHTSIGCANSFIKYAKLRELGKAHASATEPVSKG